MGLLLFAEEWIALGAAESLDSFLSCKHASSNWRLQGLDIDRVRITFILTFKFNVKPILQQGFGIDLPIGP